MGLGTVPGVELEWGPEFEGEEARLSGLQRGLQWWGEREREKHYLPFSQKCR